MLWRYSRHARFAAADYDSFLPWQKRTEPRSRLRYGASLFGLVFEWRGMTRSAAREMDQARLHLDRVTERERYLILATGYEFQGLYEKAAEQYRLLTQVYRTIWKDTEASRQRRFGPAARKRAWPPRNKLSN
jgi:hypothetical protein